MSNVGQRSIVQWFFIHGIHPTFIGVFPETVGQGRSGRCPHSKTRSGFQQIAPGQVAFVSIHISP